MARLLCSASAIHAATVASSPCWPSSCLCFAYTSCTTVAVGSPIPRWQLGHCVSLYDDLSRVTRKVSRSSISTSECRSPDTDSHEGDQNDSKNCTTRCVAALPLRFARLSEVLTTSLPPAHQNAPADSASSCRLPQENARSSSPHTSCICLKLLPLVYASLLLKQVAMVAQLVLLCSS
jgi:hypothetical protein